MQFGKSQCYFVVALFYSFMVLQQLVLPPRSIKVLGLNLLDDWGPSVWSLKVSVILTGDLKLVFLCAYILIYLSLFTQPQTGNLLIGIEISFWKIGLLMMGHKLYMQGGYSHSLIIFFNGQQGAAPLVAKMLGRIESQENHSIVSICSSINPSIHLVNSIRVVQKLESCSAVTSQKAGHTPVIPKS